MFKKKRSYCEKKVLPQAAKLPRTSGLFKKGRILRKRSAPGSEAARDKWLVQKKSYFEKEFCPRQRSCPGQVASSTKKNSFLPKVLPQAAKLSGTSGFFKKKSVSAKSSAPGSEAARDKWLLQKEVSFLPKVLPQAAKLPRTSGFFKKHQFSAKSSAPGSEAAPDKWFLHKKN